MELQKKMKYKIMYIKHRFFSEGEKSQTEVRASF